MGPVFAQQRIDLIDKLVPLTDDERRRLQEHFSDYSNLASGDALSGILGAERAAQYEQATAAAWMQLQEERIEEKVSVLSRSLGLTADQERDVSNIFRQLEADREEALANMGDTSPGKSREDLPVDAFLNFQREMQSREEGLREAVNEKLSAVLSPDQYSAYLSRESNSPKRLLGLEP